MGSEDLRSQHYKLPTRDQIRGLAELYMSGHCPLSRSEAMEVARFQLTDTSMYIDVSKPPVNQIPRKEESIVVFERTPLKTTEPVPVFSGV